MYVRMRVLTCDKNIDAGIVDSLNEQKHIYPSYEYMYSMYVRMNMFVLFMYVCICIYYNLRGIRQIMHSS